VGEEGGGEGVTEKEYQPQLGSVDVDETFVTDYWGQQHLSHLRVSVRVRLPHDAALKIKQRYPHARLDYILDECGEAAEIEILLRLTDDDVMPYIEWRDKMLERIYQEAAK
jgi:hypothetical protein